MSKKNIEITEVLDIDSGGVLGYMGSGHIDKELFKNSVADEFDDEITIAEINHIFVKRIPINRYEKDYYGVSTRYLFSVTKRKYYSPVTWWGLELG